MKILSALLFLITLTNATFGQSDLTQFIDAYLKNKEFNGTILIQRESKTIHHRSYGLANYEFKIPNKVDTKYKIASITKLFTSVLIMQLVEKGSIDLYKPIKSYLPDYKGEGGDKITIHQLLNHTSGMANMDTVTSIESALKNGVPAYQKPRTTDELLRNFGSARLVNKPGEVFDYNNADYIVLGKVIEKIYSKTFEQVLVENILNPLNMTNSGLIYQDRILEGLADTYFYRDDLKRLMPDLPVYMENWYAAGSMYATTNDLLKFSNALFGLNLLSQESLNKMFVSGLDEYGYGVWVYEDYEINGKMYKIIKRPGQIMGAHTMLFHVQTKATIIILSNTGTISLDDFAAKLAVQIVR
ncbi:MAG: serine hydrolase domain-containing protein [Cyclobacteriaceae bacterium]